MASSLTSTTLQVNGTQEITGISNTLNDNTNEIVTSGGLIDFLYEHGILLKRLAVGGTIFYIDSTADGTYTFYNASGVEVPTPTVGTDCTGWTYTVSGASKDKFYAADLSNKGTYLNRQYDDTYYIVWATSGEDLSSYSASIDVLDSANDTVGTGKRNSDWIKTNKGSSGVYYPKTLGGTANRISIWEIRDEANAAKANGCEDWYCPSAGELAQLRNNSGLTLSEWHDAVKYGSSARSFVWASSAYSNSNNAWFWGANPKYDNDYANYNDRYIANNNFACVLVRSF